MIIFAKITQLLRCRFIQGMNPSLKMHKALKIQQTTLLTILCTMSIWYSMKHPCKEDSLLIGFRHLFTTRFANRPECDTSIHDTAAFVFIICSMKFKDDSSNSTMKRITTTWKQSKLFVQCAKEIWSHSHEYSTKLLKYYWEW